MTMSATLALIATILVVFVLLDLAAYRWGTDSRPGPDERPDWW
jgi:hypothetical protein